MDGVGESDQSAGKGKSWVETMEWGWRREVWSWFQRQERFLW